MSKSHKATVIVAVVIIQDEKLLMVQEAKAECKGKYYLPGTSSAGLELRCSPDWHFLAGRMESGETLQQAAIREVKEEAGFDIEPTGIFAVEFNPIGNGYEVTLSLQTIYSSLYLDRLVWQRFCMTANITGGTLKTQPDQESLKAEWIPLANLENTPLRAYDVLGILESYKAHHTKAIPFGLASKKSKTKGDSAF